LSIVLTKEYKTEQAIEIIHKLIDLSDETGDWGLGAYSRINLSGLYINQLDYEEALIQLEEVENIYNGLDLSDVALREYIDQQKPLLYNNLGTVYQGLNELDSALFIFRKALVQTEENRKIESTIEIENDT
ncbi:MAG: tetratricopeptide (TPR) repeat protein, partial [Saprospiraceae bacterium]